MPQQVPAVEGAEGTGCESQQVEKSRRSLLSMGSVLDWLQWTLTVTGRWYLQGLFHCCSCGHLASELEWGSGGQESAGA